MHVILVLAFTVVGDIKAGGQIDPICIHPLGNMYNCIQHSSSPVHHLDVLILDSICSSCYKYNL